MSGHRFRLTVLLCAMLCAVLMAGCARKQPAKNFIPPAGGLVGIWTFRHAATLELPDADITLPFTGVMRLDANAREAHAVVLSTMGLTLLDITVDTMGHTVRFLHPSLSRLPDATANAASVIRFLWLGKVLPDEAATGGATALTEGFVNGWAEKITLNGKRFVLRVTLVEALQETK